MYNVIPRIYSWTGLPCLRLDGSDYGGKARVRQEEVRARTLIVFANFQSSATGKRADDYGWEIELPTT